MTREEFSKGFNTLTMAFSVTNIEDKSKIYFENLQNIKAPIFLEACRRIVRDFERFPTIATLLKISDTVSPPSTTHAAKQVCTMCDGYGWRMFDGYAFRGRCEHGAGLSKSIPFVPDSEIDRFNWKTVKNKNESLI